ncbi:MAG: hypothetical protein KDA90_06225 [Planctomycetaceae bacterium]|nr:hypothetical protein [Planctomycetaceae bacterium]
MSSRKPQPLIPRQRHTRCPVCGENSYSRSGVHPQCSVRQADQVRLTRLSEARQQLAAAAAVIE